MVDQIRDPFCVSAVRNQSDVVFIDDDIPALPFIDVIEIIRAFFGIAFKEDDQVSDPSEVDIGIDHFISVKIRILSSVLIDKGGKIIAGSKKTESDHIGAYAVIVIGIAAGIVDAFVFWMRRKIFKGAVQYVSLIVNAIAILIMFRNISDGFTGIKIRFSLITGALIRKKQQGCDYDKHECTEDQNRTHFSFLHNSMIADSLYCEHTCRKNRSFLIC